MNKQPPDQAARDQALDTRKSFIIQAPAGSGKTGLLTQRFLALLAQVEQPEEILAITFTRKATAEMKQRLLEALEMASEDKPAEDYLATTWHLANKVLQKDKQQNWQLLQQPSRLKIQTIDGLCASLVRQLPLLSGLGGNLPTTDNASELYQLAAKTTVLLIEDEEYGPSLKPLLHHFDGKLSRIQDLLADMLQKRLNWHPLIAYQYERAVLENTWSAWIQQRIEHLAARMLAIKHKMQPFWVFSCEQRAQISSDKNLIDAEAFRLFAHKGWPDSSLDALPQWKLLSDLLLTNKGFFRKTVNIKQGFPAASAAKDKQQAGLFIANKKAFIELLDDLSLSEEAEIEEIRLALIEIQQLPIPGFSDEHWDVLESLGVALKLSLAQLWLVFKESGTLDFNEIALRAQQALGDEEQPTDLTLRLDYQLSHILVDEFQDTSQNQRQLLTQLTAGWQQDDGRTLFVVGDPMQSIYRFRAAEVSIFLEAWHSQSLADISLECLQLSANFRSQSTIIDWVNQSFQHIFPLQDDSQLSAVSYARSIPMKKAVSEDAINVLAMAGKNDEKEAQWIKNQIVNIQTQNSNETIAILVSSKSHLKEITVSLRKAGIGFEAVDVEPLNMKPEIQDLYSLTAAMLDPLDAINWLAILRAPWCGLSLRDLTLLLESTENAPSEVINDSEKLHALSAQGKQRLSHFCSIVNQWLAVKDKNNFVSWLQSLWLSLGGAGCYDSLPNQTVLANVQTYFNLLDKNIETAEISLTRLQQAMDMLFSHTDKSMQSPVFLMSMHKSKGLEFDHVFLPGLGKRKRNIDQPMLEWMEWPQENGAVEFLLAPMKGIHEKDNPFYRVIQQINKAKANFEQQRLLYVATTRAKKCLYFSGHIKHSESEKPDPSSLLNQLWPSLKSYFSSLKDEEIESSSHASFTIQRLSSMIDVEIKSRNFYEQETELESIAEEIQNFSEDIEYSWASDRARIIGIIAHKIFQWLAILNTLPDESQIVSLRPWLVTQLQHHGVTSQHMNEAVETLNLLVKNISTSSRGQWILSSKHKHTKNEWSLKVINNLKNRTISQYIIDRSFVDENNIRWIIDYKTGRHEGSDVEAFIESEVKRYRQQLQTYGDIVSEFDSREIRLALYFPAFDRWSEWAYQKKMNDH